MPWIPLSQFKKPSKKPKARKTNKAKGKPRWKLIGFDTLSYTLKSYPSLEAAEAAAQERLIELEQTQPSTSSGGQSGIQDRVFIERPDGTQYRVFPSV
jgi:hypothetical protein